MDNLRRILPSAGALVVFEAAGRLGGFTAAARELGMSQAAVSYAVRGLEEQLGVPLFRRAHRRVVLTDAGARFFADVTQGLSQIRRSAEELRAQVQGRHVTLAASTAFASLWMTPRLQRLREDLPGVDLRIQTSDRDLDLRTERIQLGIRGGTPGEWPDCDASPFAVEEIDAVASPAYLRSNGHPETPEELVRHRLIHLDEPHRPAATWTEWFRSAGVDPRHTPRGLVVNDYALVIQAVMEGQGVALGWRHLTARLVETGLLVRVGAHSLKTGRAFYVVWNTAHDLPRTALEVRDWLLRQSEAP
ncbi:LysR substrate-binding domain-containing protein [Lutibaculum baratangense]|uniref:Transcriptional regulator n=1 Tax=Lutibaculum baratangense AMV1 TaxID=631454 RepID=V4RKH0_9HYPH|nr:LysR substrate-binding domain-containing protein [Lutibaculum baratangense]ESR23755.1 transcriptional regulator [Lutibaculum baratangense AMV1]